MNIELLKRAYEIIEAIPDNVIDLNYIHRRTDCGTVCCAAGWLAQHPEFQALGLYLTPAYPSGVSGGSLIYYGKKMGYERALSRVFDSSSWGEAGGLFCPRGDLDEDEHNFPGTDKELWLYRVRNYLADYKAAVDDLAKDLED